MVRAGRRLSGATWCSGLALGVYNKHPCRGGTSPAPGLKVNYIPRGTGQLGLRLGSGFRLRDLIDPDILVDRYNTEPSQAQRSCLPEAEAQIPSQDERRVMGHIRRNRRRRDQPRLHTRVSTLMVLPRRLVAGRYLQYAGGIAVHNWARWGPSCHDTAADGIPDGTDNSPDRRNPTQTDTDTTAMAMLAITARRSQTRTSWIPITRGRGDACD